MNIFVSIYRGWTIYEWVLLGSSIILIFLLINLATYLLTKSWEFNKSISLTLLASAILYILILFVGQYFQTVITHLSLIPVLVIPVLLTINWITLISYYGKHKKRKGFSLVELIDEHRRDSIRNIIFLTLAILSVLIFLSGELLFIFLTIYITSALSMYLNTFLTEKFLND